MFQMFNSNYIVKKNSNIKNIVMVLLLCLLLYLPIISKANVVEPTSNFYVNDYANVLSKTTKEYIQNTSVSLEEKTGAQVVVVTVPSLDGIDIESYANELFNKWEIGDKKKENGLLLLCSYGDRKFRIEVGYGLEGALPDGKTGRIQDEYIIPHLREDDFDKGIKDGYSVCIDEIANEYNVNIDGLDKNVESSEDGYSLWDIIMGIALFIFIFWISFRFRGPFIFFGGGSGNFHSGGGFSGGGFSGGGGHSGGGGSSRSF